MYQIICPVLEGLQATEGLEASDGCRHPVQGGGTKRDNPGLGETRRYEIAARVLALFDTRYRDFTAKHFHEKLVGGAADLAGAGTHAWCITSQPYAIRRAGERTKTS